jgi:hypothetical protein
MKKHESASDDFEGLLSTPGKALTLIGLSTPERLRRASEYIYIYIYILIIIAWGHNAYQNHFQRTST